jgi:hypothetical protein
MDIVNLKTWHWVVIGALAGAFIGTMHISFRPDWMASRAPTIGQEDFERGLLHTTASGHRVLDRIVVHPKESSGFQWISALYTQATRLHSNLRDHESPMVDAEIRTAVKFRAADPYMPLEPTAAFSGASDVRKYLEAVQKRPDAGAFRFQYAWYELPAIEMLLWVCGCTALIGGLWPVVLGLLVGAGFGPKEPPPAYDLSRFHPSPGYDPRKAMAAAVAKLDALLALIEENERRLARGDEDLSAEPAATTAVKAPAEIRPLVALPVEPLAAPLSQAEKDFAGEFYPTETHVPHRRE